MSPGWRRRCEESVEQRGVTVARGEVQDRAVHVGIDGLAVGEPGLGQVAGFGVELLVLAIQGARLRVRASQVRVPVMRTS